MVHIDPLAFPVWDSVSCPPPTLPNLLHIHSQMLCVLLRASLLQPTEQPAYNWPWARSQQALGNVAWKLFFFASFPGPAAWRNI